MTRHLQWENITIANVNFCEEAIVAKVSNEAPCRARIKTLR